MTYIDRASPAPRRLRIHRTRVAALLVVLAAIAAALGNRVLGPSSSDSSSSSHAHAHVPRGEQRDPLGEAGGAVPDDTTVFDDGIPGVAKLDAALIGAVRQAATSAEGDGIEFVVDSGWRSPAYQEHLLQEAIVRYGSEEEASRWVATPETSAHVSGDAIDIGPPEAAEWLAEHGAAYGLCQVYDNEPWHYELRPEAPAQGCPALYADPTQDPRMRR